MRRLILTFVALTLSAPVYAQTEADKVAPTIPGTQIKPAEIATAYEFLSAATSADEFVIDSAPFAEANSQSAEIKALAENLAAVHNETMKASIEAGKADEVEIAAPSPDGEQEQLLHKLEILKGPEFDRAYVEAQLFLHQRAIAYYKGYANEGNNLAKFAGASLPQLLKDYDTLTALGGTVGVGTAAQTPSAQ